jgi:ribose transport system permease protein
MTTVALSNAAVTGVKPWWQRILTRNAWVIGVWLLLGVLIFWYSHLVPRFGSFQIASITKNSLPLIYLAIGQAIIVIAGGIDLSLGPLLLLSNVIAARFMHEQPFGIVLLVGLGILIGLGLLNAGVGYIIDISGAPDIVVTLATSYIWSGVALMILPSPGGGTAPEFRMLFTGSASGVGGHYVVPIIMIIIPTLIVYFYSRYTRLGLSIYAIGSSNVAARLAGLKVLRAKVVSYGIGGAMAGLAGLATIALTNNGDPRFSIGANATLNSVAAIVLGGIALTGGSGSVLGVVATGIILIMLNPILSAMGINANTAQVIQGALIAGVMMIGGLVTLYRERSS